MSRLQGHVTAVYREVYGDEVAAATTGTTLIVADAVDFSDTGGHLLYGDVVYTYTSVDDDTGTILGLSPALPAASVAGDRVAVWDPQVEDVVAEWVADVVDDHDGSPIEAPIDHALIDLLPTGVRGLTGESVICEERAYSTDGDGEWWLTRVDGKAPVASPPAQPLSIRSRTTNWTMGSTGWQPIPLGDYISGQGPIKWLPGASQWEIRSEGLYQISASARFINGTGGDVGLRILAGSTVIGQERGPYSGNVSFCVSGLLEAKVGRKVQIEAYNTTGSPPDVASDVRAAIYLI